MLAGGAGNDSIDGGAGNDTAAFSLNFNDYTVQDFGAKIVVNGPDGVNTTLSSIEHLVFEDTAITPADMVNDGDPLFDTLYYLSRNPDVFQAGVNALDHYNTFGWHEGRDPNALFDTSGYLAVNQDVAASGMNPLEHYHQIGWQQGRDPGADFDTTLYLVHNPDVAAAGIDPLAHYLQFGFAEGRAGLPGDRAEHRQRLRRAILPVPQSGRGGGRRRSAAALPTVRLARGAQPERPGSTPPAICRTTPMSRRPASIRSSTTTQFGWHEGRDPSASFDTLGYLAANPDVAAAGVNPLDHYLKYGIYEGRQLGNDGMWG